MNMVNSKNISLFPPFSKSSKCEVCQCYITEAEFLQLKELDYLVCRKSFCKRIMSKKSRMTPFFFKHYLESQKNIFKQLRDNDRKKQEYSEKINKNEREQNRKLLQTFLDNNPKFSEKEIDVIKIPSGLKKIATPENIRIKKYSEHLSTIIQKAMENIINNTFTDDQNTGDIKDKLLILDHKFSKIPKLKDMTDKLCGMCKGGCCPAGSDHAYLSVSTITQLIKTKPDLSVAEIRELYLSRVNSKTVIGACINQTRLGCSLPRDMRSNICNVYYCDSVKSYINDEAHMDAKHQKMVFAVQWSNTNWNRLDSSFDNEIVNSALINNTNVLHES